MFSRRSRFFALVGFTVLVGAFALGSIGCDEKEAQAQRAKVEALYNDAVASNDIEKVKLYGELLGKADKTIAEIKADPVPATTDAVKDNPLMDLVPEPIKAPAVLGLALFASIWRAIRWKNAAKSIAKSIEKLPETTKWDDPLTITTLDANQSPAARVAVDLAQGKKVSLIDRII